MTKEERLMAATAYVKNRYGDVSYSYQERDAFLAGAQAEADSKRIGIKTKDDLPKDNNDYWVVDKNGNVSVKSGFIVFDEELKEPCLKMISGNKKAMSLIGNRAFGAERNGRLVKGRLINRPI